MPDIPGFPRKTVKRREWYDLNINSKDIDDVIAALQSIKGDYASGSEFEVDRLVVTRWGSNARVKVQEPESDSQYEKRYAKRVEKLQKEGLTEKYMLKRLEKTNKALAKFERKKDETVH